MAKFGCKYFVIAKITEEPANALPKYDDPVVCSELQSIEHVDNFVEAKQSGDNKTVEYVQEYVDTNINTGLCDLSPDVSAASFGASKVAGTGTGAVGSVQYKAGDTHPYVGVGATTCKLIHNVYSAYGHFWPKAKALPTSRAYATRENGSITLDGENLNFSAVACNNGLYHEESEAFTGNTREAAEAAAKAWVDDRVKKVVTAGP